MTSTPTCNKSEQIKAYSLPAATLKRVLDITIATSLGAITLPIIGVAIIIIQMVDRGTPLYVQQRLGHRSKPFGLIKLRTMRMHSDVWLESHMAANPSENDPRIFRVPNDPRLLPRIGMILRRYSIDELPQLWNVLRGDISLVGPRALPLYHCELLSREFLEFRSSVRPGITGLWQIEGRADASPATIERLDRKHLGRQSFRYDLGLLYRTAFCVFKGSGL